MRPYLIKISIPFSDIILPIHSYGFMLALAFVSAILVASRQVKKQGEAEDDLFNLAYWIVISSILGSRFFHCFVYWENYAAEPWRIFFVWEGGLVYYGGLLAAILAAIIFLRVKGLSFWKWADIIAPTIALGLVFGRTGCLLVGCCYGKPCPVDHAMALSFPSETVGIAGVPLYPTQIWSMAGNLLIFAITYFVILPQKKYHGQVLAWFLILYGIFRTGVEFWRADPRGFATLFHISGPPGATVDSTTGLFSKLLFFEALWEKSPGIFAFQISESQLVSLLLFVFAALLMIVQRKRAPVSAKKAAASTSASVE